MDTEIKVFFEAFEERLNEKFLRIDQRFDSVEMRLEGVEGRLEGLEDKFYGLEKSMDGLEQNQNDMQEQIAYLVDHFGKFEDGVKTLLRSHDVRLTNLEARVQFV